MTNSNTNINTDNNKIETPGLPVVVHAQYIKDLSFENPNAPDSLKAGLPAAKMDMDIQLAAVPMKSEQIDNLHEMVITLTAKAIRDNQTVFIAEIAYASLVSIHKDVPEENIRPLLFIDIAASAFPFARQIIATLTQQGGYPPLLLNPVDFRAMYLAQYASKAEEAA